MDILEICPELRGAKYICLPPAKPVKGKSAGRGSLLGKHQKLNEF